MTIAPRMFITPFTVAPGVSATLPVTLDDLWLQRIRIVIPDGHAGLTALQIQQGGIPLFPFGADPFIRGNDEVVDFEWDGEVTAGGLSLFGVNNDVWPHEWIVRWTITDLPAAGTPVVVSSPQAAPVAPADIQAVADLTGALQ